MSPVYDRIGEGFARHRRADRRIVDRIVRLLDLPPGAVIADIGAGTGNYAWELGELGYRIEAVEPSEVMRSQARAHDLVRWHDGVAEELPLPDTSTDGVICILAAHHFRSRVSAGCEMARVCPSGPIVWLTFDAREADDPWFVDYFPTLWGLALGRCPPIGEVSAELAEAIGRRVEVFPFPVPWDLEDCFMSSGWRRPELYLNAEIRSGISAFQLSEPEVVEEALARLASDLESGAWGDAHGHVLDQDSVDWGYRFLVSRPGAREPRSWRSP
jgi:ubiquinone/menaquinone biosynthesis C-methylase UbiE